MRPSELKALIVARFRAAIKRPLLIEGSPGLGKTQIAGQAARELGVAFRAIHLPTVLRDFLSQRAKVDLSYARPKRRFADSDILLPSLAGERLGRIAVAIDCSGSISEDTVSEFAAEIRAIAEDTAPEAIEVLYFDSAVLSRRTFERGEEIEIEAQGGGGTAFSPIFAALAEGEPPIACVVLTDLCCSDFGDAPEFPVLWASTEEGSAPFGTITRIMRGV